MTWKTAKRPMHKGWWIFTNLGKGLGLCWQGETPGNGYTSKEQAQAAAAKLNQ